MPPTLPLIGPMTHTLAETSAAGTATPGGAAPPMPPPDAGAPPGPSDGAAPDGAPSGPPPPPAPPPPPPAGGPTPPRPSVGMHAEKSVGTHPSGDPMKHANPAHGMVKS